jgi:hypothetical protein
VTVAVHVDDVLMTVRSGLQPTDVVVLRLPTATANVPELVLCTAEPW